jgi:hypothetical protein
MSDTSRVSPSHTTHRRIKILSERTDKASVQAATAAEAKLASRIVLSAGFRTL